MQGESTFVVQILKLILKSDGHNLTIQTGFLKKSHNKQFKINANIEQKLIHRVKFVYHELSIF